MTSSDCLLSTALLLLLAAPILSGATVTPAGNHTDLGPSWRNPDVAKPLDLDNNQVLGSDGYHLVNLPASLPSYVSSWTTISTTYPGNGEYSMIDVPGQPGELFLTGTMNPRPGPGVSVDTFAFTLGETAEGRMIRVGLLVDNLDGAGWNATSLTLVQTDSTQSTSGPVPTVTGALNNRIPDWVFFDILGAKAGDRFVVRATGGPNGTATVGGVAFDSITSVSGPVRTSSQGVASPYPSRIVLGEPPQGLYRMTLTLSNLTSPAQGMSLLLVGPGGQKIRPMSHAFGTFDTAGGPTTLAFDDYAATPIPILSEGAIARGTYKPDTDQSPPSLPAPAPPGPYSSTMSAGQSGPVAGVWSLYVAGTSVRLDSWDLTMVPIREPIVTNFATWLRTTAAAPYSWIYRSGMSARVTPGGLTTAAWLEWGPTPELGFTTPLRNLGAGDQPIEFIEAIPPELGGTFHLRIAASNQLGVVYSERRSVSLPLFFETFVTGPKPAAGASPGCLDFNNDGKLDLLFARDLSRPSQTQVFEPGIWKNTGSGFVPLTQPGIPGVDRGQASPGDADNDGRLDFLINGFTESGRISQLWFNTGVDNPAFERVDLRGIPGAGLGAVTWGDYDNDGRLDFLLTGSRDNPGIGQLWRNSGSAFVNVTASTLPGFPAIADGSVAWGDYDRDGWLDILISGSLGSGAGTTQIWRNTGSGFARLPESATPGLAQLRGSSVAWGDYDNDGRLDFLIGGETTEGQRLTQIWHNTGNGFSNVTGTLAAAIPGIFRGTAAWADHDNDGRLDILLVRQNLGHADRPQLWRNTGSGFENISDAAFPNSNLRYNSGTWGDMDNDGRLDLILGAATPEGQNVIEIARSRIWTTNTPPTPPKDLIVSAGPTGVTFAWQPATDAQTPSGGLSYHLRVGTIPGGSDLVSAMAGPDGRALLPRHGALSPGLTRTIIGLPTGRTLYWSVQAQDTAFAGSEFATGQSFRVGHALATSTGELIPGDSNGDGAVDDRELNLVLGRLQAGLRTLNTAGFYSPAQIQALNVGRPMLERAPSGEFKLTLALEKATQLTNFTPFPFLAPQTRINESGALEFLFSSPDDAAFFRLDSR